jgi:hypothetical protein
MTGGMTTRGTLALLGMLVALAGYIWLVELRPRRAVPSEEAAPATLLAVPSSSIMRVELEEHGRRLTAHRRDGYWEDERGRRWRDDVVSGLVDTLVDLRPVMVVERDAERLAEYGLGSDAARLRLVGREGKTALALELGQRNPAWTGLYARIAEGREVILLGGVLDWELTKLRRAAPEP